MKKNDWSKIKELFHQTLDLPAEERTKFLEKHDESVRLEVGSLLASHEKAEDFIATPAAVEMKFNADYLIGQKIGDYEILEKIGAGGMGAVYLAQKKDLEIKFALKIIKRGMDTDAILKRFALERQILSRLEHPFIARLLDAGVTENGLPYFVMEHIEGVPITKFCEAHRLSLDERLELFQKVCAAVNYAHQNLIVHRDIKPSNILVTNDGTPKLLDFGIAKLLNSQEFERTATQARIFTPEYASPEQQKNLPITTAADVYSLGIVLHEILSGNRPSSTDKNTARNIEKSTNEKESNTNPKSKIQNPKSQNDLSNIVQKSLREEPHERYQTISEFSEDIRRFLAGLPVTATADSSFYRLSKFVRRHRQGVIAGALVSLLILSLSGFAVWQAIEANRERAKAEKRFEQVRRLANIVLFEYHDGIAALPGATAMREKMVTDSLDFLDNLSAEAIENKELQRDIAKAYKKVGDIQGASDTGNVGKTQAALQSYRKAFEIWQKLPPENSTELMFSGDLLIEIGLSQRSLGELQEAEKSFLEALGIFTNLPEDSAQKASLAKAFWNIASLQTAQNNLDGSLENYGKALAIYENLGLTEAKHRRNAALTNKNIGSVLQLRGEYEKALTHFNKSLEIDAENVRNNPNNVSANLDLSFTYGTLAAVLRDAGKFPESEENYRRAIEIREKIFHADSKNAFAENALARGYQELGRTFLAQKKFSESITQIEKAQRIYQKMFEADKENTDKQNRLAENTALLGKVFGLQNNISKAAGLFEKAFAIYADLLDQEKLSPFQQKQFASARLDFAEILLQNRQTEKARENLNQARILLEKETIKKDASKEIERLTELLKEAA